VVAGRTVAGRGWRAGLTLKIVLLILASPDHDLTRGERPYRPLGDYTCGNSACRDSMTKAEFDYYKSRDRTRKCSDCGQPMTKAGR
jgi:hypothetical protein